MKKKKKKKLCKFEKFMYKLCIFLTISLVVLIICSETSLARINLDVQKLNDKVDEQTKLNESLEMKIDEMTSLERIKKISEEYDLSYNSEQIKTID